MISAEQLERDRADCRRKWRDAGLHGDRTLGDRMSETVRRHPDSWALFQSSDGSVRADLAELHEWGARVAGGLGALGLRRGDVIAVQVPNRLECAVAYVAAINLGLVIVPIVHIYEAAEVGFILRESGARALIVPQRWRKVDYAERIRALGTTPMLEHIVMVGDEPTDYIPWQQLAGAEPVAPVGDVDPDDVCLLIYTSGTTSSPKGVQHSHNSTLAELDSTESILGRGPDSISLAAFPAGHIAGVLNLLRLFVLGSCTVLMDQWDPLLAAQLVQRYGITSTSGAPIFLASMLDAAAGHGLDLTSLRSYVVGGAAVPPALVERADTFGVHANRAYGSSEHPVLTISRSSDSLERRSTTDGWATPGNEIRIVDDDGNDVPLGSDGEVACRGPEQFVGYRDPELDRSSYLAGAWFCTGDIGRLDSDGYLTITDRKKDIVIRGGENISSREVEDILARHPAVLDSAVVGMPDERYGERVCAFVELREGRQLDLDDVVRHFAAAGVAKQKTPERVIQQTLPRAMSGKVKKFELRAQLRHPDGES